MGLTREVLDSLYSGGGGSKLGYPTYGERVLGEVTGTGPHTILAAPSAGTCRRVGIGNSESAGTIYLSAGSTTVDVFVGTDQIASESIGAGSAYALPPCFIPAGSALTFTLTPSATVYYSAGWMSHADTDYGTAVVDLTGVSPVSVIGPVPAGKVYIPLTKLGDMIYYRGFNSDTVDHGFIVSIDDGADDFLLFASNGVSWGSGNSATFETGGIPLHAGDSLLMALTEAITTTNPVVFIPYAILDEV